MSSSTNSCSPAGVTRYALRVRQPGAGRRRTRAAARSPLSEPVATNAAGRGVGRVDRLDRAGLLEPAQRRVQRAERDAPQGTERLGQALLQLVAVKWLLREQSEDGELQHETTPRGSGRASESGGTRRRRCRSGVVRYIESIYRRKPFRREQDPRTPRARGGRTTPGREKLRPRWRREAPLH